MYNYKYGRLNVTICRRCMGIYQAAADTYRYAQKTICDCRWVYSRLDWHMRLADRCGRLKNVTV